MSPADACFRARADYLRTECRPSTVAARLAPPYVSIGRVLTVSMPTGPAVAIHMLARLGLACSWAVVPARRVPSPARRPAPCLASVTGELDPPGLNVDPHPPLIITCSRSVDGRPTAQNPWVVGRAPPALPRFTRESPLIGRCEAPSGCSGPLSGPQVQRDRTRPKSRASRRTIEQSAPARGPAGAFRGPEIAALVVRS